MAISPQLTYNTAPTPAPAKTAAQKEGIHDVQPDGSYRDANGYWHDKLGNLVNPLDNVDNPTGLAQAETQTGHTFGQQYAGVLDMLSKKALADGKSIQWEIDDYNQKGAKYGFTGEQQVAYWENHQATNPDELAMKLAAYHYAEAHDIKGARYPTSDEFDKGGSTFESHPNWGNLVPALGFLGSALATIASVGTAAPAAIATGAIGAAGSLAAIGVNDSRAYAAPQGGSAGPVTPDTPPAYAPDTSNFIRDTSGNVVSNLTSPNGTPLPPGTTMASSDNSDYQTKLANAIKGATYTKDPSLAPSNNPNIKTLTDLGTANTQLASQYTPEALQLISDAAQGKTPSQAEALAQKLIDQSVAAQAATAGAARGGNLAAAQRAAAISGVQQRQQGAADLAALRAQEMANARAQLMQGALGTGQVGVSAANAGASATNTANQTQISDALANTQAALGQGQLAIGGWQQQQAPTIAAIGPNASKDINTANNNYDWTKTVTGGAFTAGGNVLTTLINKFAPGPSPQNATPAAAPAAAPAAPAAPAATPSVGTDFDTVPAVSLDDLDIYLSGLDK